MSLPEFVLFAVDASVTSRIMLQSIFAEEYQVSLFDSAENCLAQLATQTPSIILTEVELPGMNGFAFCQKIKNHSTTQNIPVIFISGRNCLEDRLHGYDAGGEDFIFKPYAIDEVRHHVEVVRHAFNEAMLLKQQMADSELLSSLLLSNIDEYAILIQSIRNLTENTTPQEFADTLLTMLRQFGLEGAVQLRLGEEVLSISDQGKERPLEVAVLNHVRTLERIFQFRRRCVFNFEHLTLLVNNMPIEDMDKTGRLRDHLAIATEMANSRLMAHLSTAQNSYTQTQIVDMLQDIRQTIDDFIERSRRARAHSTQTMTEMLDSLITSFAPLGMSSDLEEDIENMVREKAQALITLHDNHDETTATLEDLKSRLETLSHSSTAYTK